MQLKVSRSQKPALIFLNRTIYCLDIMAEYSPEEKALINGKDFGGKIIYESTSRQDNYEYLQSLADAGNVACFKGVYTLALTALDLKITVASLARGHHIEAREPNALAEAEASIIAACKNLKQYLATSATFSGREDVIEI